MGLDKTDTNIPTSSMEELDIIENAGSLTGERIKLFVDELECLELSDDANKYVRRTAPHDGGPLNSTDFNDVTQNVDKESDRGAIAESDSRDVICKEGVKNGPLKESCSAVHKDLNIDGVSDVNKGVVQDLSHDSDRVFLHQDEHGNMLLDANSNLYHDTRHKKSNLEARRAFRQRAPKDLHLNIHKDMGYGSHPYHMQHSDAYWEMRPQGFEGHVEEQQIAHGGAEMACDRTQFGLHVDPELEFGFISGQEVQRISVINALPDLLTDSYADCMRRVVPKVREVLHVAQSDMQLVASSTFIEILAKNLVPVNNYAQTFLQTILSSIDNKDPDIANAWLETLLDVIDLLPKDIIKKDILTIAIEKGQLSQPVQTRLSCCKILGKIATRFEPFVIKKEILPIVQSLCQDVEYEVRGCMCEQLDPVSRGLGLEATKSAILPELVELTNDEESYVRIAGLKTVVNILSLVDEDTCRTTLIPLVCKVCQQSVKAEDITVPIVAKEIGRLCHGLAAYLTDEQKQWFVDFFKQMCKVGLLENKKKTKDGDTDSLNKDQQVPLPPDIIELEERLIETRTNCAFNFPAMVMFVGAKQFKAELGACFSSLCKDSSVSVRRTLSAGFHEIACLMGANVSSLLGDMIVLLHDENTEVLTGVVTHLPETLTAICGPLNSQAMHEVKQNQISDIIPAILSAEVVIAASHDWRLQERIIEHFRCFQYLTNSENVYSKIMPVLLNKLRRARALPVRMAAVKSTLLLIRKLKKFVHRTELMQKLVTEFCHGQSCHRRSLFIDICRVAIDLYSKSFFKETFFMYLVSLHKDPVPNIRYRLCSLLPDLKRLIKLPSDKLLHQTLDTCVRHLLIGEKDKDVLVAIKSAVEEMDKIPVQMESALSRRVLMEEDIDDAKKEAEEKKLMELEEQELKKEEEKEKSKAEKKGHKDKLPGSRKHESESRIPLAKRKNLAQRNSDPSAAKSSTSKLTRSGLSGVPTPSSAGSRKGVKSSSSDSVARRGSFNNSPTSSDKPLRKNSVGSNGAPKKKISK